MGNSVNKIPSISIPFTDAQGRISPIWHEFLRSFIASTVETAAGEETPPGDDIVAGAGLRETGDRVFSVGAGNGISVNADDINVDINGQIGVQARLDDEVLISTPYNNNSIKKTTIRSFVKLNAPGGDDGHVQYNDNGIFGGNSSFTTNGSGQIGISSISTTTANGNLTLDPNGTGRVICDTQIGNSAGGATTRCLSLSGNAVRLYGSSSSSYVDMTSGSGPILVAGTKSLSMGTSNATFQTDLTMSSGYFARNTVATITASTTRTQGQGALTGDINAISTCANANDTVTLPAALSGRSCLVINNGAQTLQVFPASADDLGAGVNTSTTIVAGSRKWFVAFDSTNWEPVI